MRCFVIDSEMIDGRLDADYYLHHLSQATHIGSIPTEPLDEIVTFSKETWDQKGLYEDNFPYIEISEIDTVSGQINNISWIPKNEAPSRAKMLVRSGDIVVSTTRPHRGAIACISKEYDGYIASTGFAIIRTFKKDDISKEFLFYVLRTDFILNQMLQRSSGGNYPAITLQELKKVRIPHAEPDTQDQVIGIMKHAYAEKKRLEQEADDLLASIDAYILDRLGIKVSAKATKKIYIVSSKILTGKRLDPLYYSQEILKFVEALPYDHPNIGSKVQYMKTGFAAGRSEQELENFDEAIIQIRPTNMSNARTLIFDKNIHINKSVLKDKPDALLKRGEVLFNNTNSQDLVGKTVYFDEDGEYVCSNHVTRIKADPNEIDGYYLFCILNLYQRLRVFYSICTNWNNQSGVNADLLASLPIPKPDVKIQKEIANEVLARMTKAATLKKQALDQLNQAKAEVEEILFEDAA